MRIHTRHINRDGIERAARTAGVSLARLDAKGSRSHGQAWDVLLEGSGRRGTQYGNSGQFGADTNRQAALWDEWGIFLGALFRIDPDARIPGVYEDGEDFRWQTGARFDTLTPAGVCRRHRWDQPRGEWNVTRTYLVSGCRCGAITRRLAHGITWAEFSGVNA